MQSAAVAAPNTFLAGIAFTPDSNQKLTLPVSYTLRVNHSDMSGLGSSTFASNSDLGPFTGTYQWISSGFFAFQRLFEQAVLQQQTGVTDPLTNSSAIYLDPSIQEVPWAEFVTNTKAQQTANFISIYLISLFAFVIRGTIADTPSLYCTGVL